MNTLLSSTNQIKRIILWLGIALILMTVTFTGYYYYDRYYSQEVPLMNTMISNAEQAVRDDPQNVEARFGLAESYMLVGRWNDAIVQALQVQQSAPDDVRVDFVLGISYANSGKPQEAVEPLKKYIESQKDKEMLGMNKSYLAALYYLGDSYLQLGMPGEAIPPLEETAIRSKTDADAFYKLGQAYAGIGDHERAVAALEDALKFVPNFTEAYQSMALAYDALGKSNEAEYARAMISYSNKDYEKAYQSLLKTARDLPTFSPGFIGLGLTCEAKGDLQCAVDAYKMALQLKPGDFTSSQGVLRVEAAMKK